MNYDTQTAFIYAIQISTLRVLAAQQWTAQDALDYIARTRPCTDLKDVAMVPARCKAKLADRMSFLSAYKVI